jgi:energy-coupling factor transport system ATP-binding protein
VKIRIDSVSFSYPSGVHALDGVSLSADAGEMLALVGENGAGKTTLVKQLNGLLRADQGAVYIGDWLAAEHTTAQLAQRVGFLFQNPDEQLFERTVRREVGFGPRCLGGSEEQVASQVDAALRRVGLGEQAERHPYDLQYTERKLVTLAATLAQQTPILVLDEPTLGQDAHQRELIGSIIEDLHTEGRTVIIISHDLDFCADHARRVVVMADGRILADGPTAAILSQAEMLERAAVIPPQTIRLAQALDLSAAPLNATAFAAAYAAAKGKTA